MAGTESLEKIGDFSALAAWLCDNGDHGGFGVQRIRLAL